MQTALGATRIPQGWGFQPRIESRATPRKKRALRRSGNHVRVKDCVIGKNVRMQRCKFVCIYIYIGEPPAAIYIYIYSQVHPNSVVHLPNSQKLLSSGACPSGVSPPVEECCPNTRRSTSGSLIIIIILLLLLLLLLICPPLLWRP